MANPEISLIKNTDWLLIKQKITHGNGEIEQESDGYRYVDLSKLVAFDYYVINEVNNQGKKEELYVVTLYIVVMSNRIQFLLSKKGNQQKIMDKILSKVYGNQEFND